MRYEHVPFLKEIELYELFQVRRQVGRERVTPLLHRLRIIPGRNVTIRFPLLYVLDVLGEAKKQERPVADLDFLYDYGRSNEASWTIAKIERQFEGSIRDTISEEKGIGIPSFCSIFDVSRSTPLNLIETGDFEAENISDSSTIHWKIGEASLRGCYAWDRPWAAQ